MSFLKYLWHSKAIRWQIGLFGFMTVIFSVLLFRSLSHLQILPAPWAKILSEIWVWLDPFLTISAVFLALFIWYNEKKQDWEDHLPKKLNALFRLGNGDIVYQVINAPLAGADDIRQWGQQIGKQMNDNKNLEFDGLNVSGPERATDKGGQPVMRYTLTIWLQEQSAKKPQKTWEYNDDGTLITPPQAQLDPGHQNLSDVSAAQTVPAAEMNKVEV